MENNFDFIFNLGKYGKYFSLQKILAEKGISKYVLFQKNKDLSIFLFEKLESTIIIPQYWDDCDKFELIKILNVLENMEKNPSVHRLTLSAAYTRRYKSKWNTRNSLVIKKKDVNEKNKIARAIRRKNKYLNFTVEQISEESNYSICSIRNLLINNKNNFKINTLKNILDSINILQKKANVSW